MPVFSFSQPQDNLGVVSAGENWPQWIQRAMIIQRQRRSAHTGKTAQWYPPKVIMNKT